MEEWMANLTRGVWALLSGKYNLGQLWNYFKAYHFPRGLNVSHDPPRLGIFLTTKCNMKCDFCLTHSEVIQDNPYKYQGAKDMTFETFKDIIKKYPNTIIMSFIGNGEPLLNRNIFEMIKYAKSKKMGSTIFSNGLVLDKYIEPIIEADIKTINISMIAINAKEYERFTGYHHTIFDKVVQNAKLLTQAKHNAPSSKMTITATVLVDKYNYKTMAEMITFCEDIGIDEVTLSHFMPWCTEGLTAEERCIFENNIEAMEYINELASKQYGIVVTFPTIFDGKKDNRLCQDNVLSMSIDGDGNISGCERKMLNTADNGKYWEKDAFNNDHFKYLRKIFVTKDAPIPEPCEICFNNTTCETKTANKTLESSFKRNIAARKNDKI